MRVFIFGSSVSRDTLERLSPKGLSLTHFTSGQSLIPLLGTIPELSPHLDTSRLNSRSQRKGAIGTIEADIVQQLDKMQEETDLLLWDIGDERLGVFQHGLGYVTRTADLVTSGLDAVLQSNARHIPFGSDEHFHLWTRATEMWSLLLTKSRLESRTILLAPAWANAYEDGGPTSSHNGFTPHEFNYLARRYITHAREQIASLRVLGDSLETTASRRHRSGPSPFHYSDSTHDALASQIYHTTHRESGDYPVPRPMLHITGSNEIVVHTEHTWATEFSLYVHRNGTVIEKHPYQASREFVTQPMAQGEYYVKIFHRLGKTIKKETSRRFRLP